MSVGEAASLSDLAAFLHEAKRRTYAGLDDDATVSAPLLPGSKQLEHRNGDWHYCDVYFGMTRFSGIEVVRRNEKPIWSMSYSGGLTTAAKGADIGTTYRFLRAALLLADPALPLRGASSHTDGIQTYTTTTHGDLTRFNGIESITRDGLDVYQLTYAGGLIG